MLFAEASIDQMETIREIMTLFCKTSGHRINLSKSKLFVSVNVNFHRAMEFSNILGVGLTSDLGRYLGIPLFHKRVTKATFSPLLVKVRGKLSGWKGRFLSMVGRPILIKSVLSALPYYSMQTSLLLNGILDEIEKTTRSFLWNEHIEQRKLYLISWETIKKPKLMGGLGLKDLKKQNMAFIFELCWGLVTNPTALWARCLRGKYGCDNTQLPLIYPKKAMSQTWRSITQA